MINTIYPKGPTEVPLNYATIPAKYRLNTAGTLLAIILFLLIYFGMIAGSLYLIYWLLITPNPISGRYFFLYYLLVAGAIMLFLFTIKFLFKSQEQDMSGLTELKKEQHPQLFSFIDELIKETGAPKPKKVFVTPEVNAFVYYNSTVLSLFIPTKKNLVIGLGLVNSVGLSEFKAVLAHEFGHFAQGSMRLGSYVYMANKIILDMVYTRDKWDEFLSRAASIDIRISFAAWILIAAVWVIRQTLALVYKALNILHLSLSRQMEFNADRVAVQAAGSDAIINALAKLELADISLNKTFEQVNLTAHHGLYTDDIYYHQTMNSVKITDQLKRKKEHLAAFTLSNSAKPIFEKEEDYMPSMYSSHPPSYEREQNAKHPYLFAAADDRSPWVLFSNNGEELRKEVTLKLLKTSYEKMTTSTKAEEVAQFIATEEEELDFDDRYMGFFDTGYVMAIEQHEIDGLLEANKEKMATIDLSLGLDQFFDPALESHFEKLKTLSAEMHKLQNIASGMNAIKEFDHRGEKRKAKDAINLMHEVSKEYAPIEQEFKAREADLLAYQLKAAQRLSNDKLDLVLQYHIFHKIILGFLSQLDQAQVKFNKAIERLTSGDVDEYTYNSSVSDLRDVHGVMLQVVKSANDVAMPPFQMLDHYNTVGEMLKPETELRTLVKEVTGEWLSLLVNNIGGVYERCERLKMKSTARIVKNMEELEKATLSLV